MIGLVLQELDELNASRAAEFKVSEERKKVKDIKKRKEADSHKRAVLKQLLQKRQRLKPS